MADTFDPAQFNVAGVSWTCAITGGSGSCGAANGTGNIATTVDLTSGSAATYTVTAPILSAATGTLSNTATVTAPAGTTDPVAGNNTATDNDTALGVTSDLSDHEDRRRDLGGPRDVGHVHDRRDQPRSVRRRRRRRWRTRSIPRSSTWRA